MTSLAVRSHSPGHITDRGRLAVDLGAAVRGEVRFDRGSQAVYASDASLYRQVPIGVVLPRDADDVIIALAVCRAHQVPVLARGCGTASITERLKDG
jgi:FAD/FMN-containing dehydrogenase